MRRLCALAPGRHPPAGRAGVVPDQGAGQPAARIALARQPALLHGMEGYAMT